MQNFKKPDNCFYSLSEDWYRYKPQSFSKQPRFSFVSNCYSLLSLYWAIDFYVDEFWVNEEEWCVLMCVHMYGCAWLVMIECVWSSN